MFHDALVCFAERRKINMAYSELVKNFKCIRDYMREKDDGYYV